MAILDIFLNLKLNLPVHICFSVFVTLLKKKFFPICHFLLHFLMSMNSEILHQSAPLCMVFKKLKCSLVRNWRKISYLNWLIILFLSFQWFCTYFSDYNGFKKIPPYNLLKYFILENILLLFGKNWRKKQSFKKLPQIFKNKRNPE